MSTTLTMETVKFKQDLDMRLLSSSWPSKIDLRIRLFRSFGKDLGVHLDFLMRK